MKQSQTTITRNVANVAQTNMSIDTMARIATASTLRTYSHAEGGVGKISDLRRQLQADFAFLDNLDVRMEKLNHNKKRMAMLQKTHSNMLNAMVTAVKHGDAVNVDMHRLEHINSLLYRCDKVCDTDISEYADRLTAERTTMLQAVNPVCNTARLTHIAKLIDRCKSNMASIQKKLDGYCVSDAYDVYTLAYSTLLEAEMHGFNINSDIPYIYRTLKNGTQKAYTCFTYTCHIIGKYIDSMRAIKASKIVYTEDLMQSDTDTASDALDRIYIRAMMYSGIETWYDAMTFDMICARLYPVLNAMQETVLRMRMQGKSVTEIAQRLCKPQQRVSETLAAIRAKMLAIYPDLQAKHIVK